MFFQSKQKKIEKQIDEYCAGVLKCLDGFRDTFLAYCKTNDRGRLESDFAVVHKAESLCDDLRREIEVVMYTNALFPESRGDILGLLETMDRVPNQAESAVRMAMTQHVVVPDFLCKKLLELVDVCHRSVLAMLDGAHNLFTQFTQATVAVGRIDELESEGDFIEANLVEKIFSSDIEGWQKLLLRDLVKHIAQVSDRAENVGDKIRIIVAKRSV